MSSHDQITVTQSNINLIVYFLDSRSVTKVFEGHSNYLDNGNFKRFDPRTGINLVNLITGDVNLQLLPHEPSLG